MDETGVPGPPAGCGFDLYCHSSGQVYGLSTNNAFLWESNPAKGDSKIELEFKAWLASHEYDVGLDPGLSTSNLGLVRRADFRSQDGSLTVFRFAQDYRGLPVFGADGQVTVTYTPGGAISVTGTIVDDRVSYANFEKYTSTSKARTSIEHHVAAYTQRDPSEFTVEDLQRVAIPQTASIGWAGSVRSNNGGAIAQVVVDADRYYVGAVLPLWTYRDANHDALTNTQAITSTSADPAGDPAAAPLVLSDETLLTTGAPLLGSIDDVTMDVQLATEAVVVLDLQGVSHADLENGAIRVLDATGSFLASSGTTLQAQVAHHLVSSWHAYLDGYMTDSLVGAKRWDSANPFYSPFPPGAAPGTFVPRILAYVDSPAKTARRVQSRARRGRR